MFGKCMKVFFFLVVHKCFKHTVDAHSRATCNRTTTTAEKKILIIIIIMNRPRPATGVHARVYLKIIITIYLWAPRARYTTRRDVAGPPPAAIRCTAKRRRGGTPYNNRNPFRYARHGLFMRPADLTVSMPVGTYTTDCATFIRRKRNNGPSADERTNADKCAEMRRRTVTQPSAVSVWNIIITVVEKSRDERRRLSGRPHNSRSQPQPQQYSSTPANSPRWPTARAVRNRTMSRFSGPWVYWRILILILWNA